MSDAGACMSRNIWKHKLVGCEVASYTVRERHQPTWAPVRWVVSTGAVNVFKHPEADTTLLYTYAKLRTENYIEAVVLDSEDTEAYIQAAYVSLQLRGGLLIKCMQACVNQLPCHALRRNCK